MKPRIANRAFSPAVRQAILAGVSALVCSSSCWAGQGTAPSTSTAPTAPASHGQFGGVLRFLAPEAHAASQHPHPTVAASHTKPPSHAMVAVAAQSAPVAHSAPTYQAAARNDPPAGRIYNPRVATPAAYRPYAYPQYAYPQYAYPRYAYPVVAWQGYGYRGIRYVYYYAYPGGYSGY